MSAACKPVNSETMAMYPQEEQEASALVCKSSLCCAQLTNGFAPRLTVANYKLQAWACHSGITAKQPRLHCQLSYMSE